VEANLGLRDATTALALLAGLTGDRPRESAHALADLMGSDRKLLPVAEVLTRWASAERRASEGPAEVGF